MKPIRLSTKSTLGLVLFFSVLAFAAGFWTSYLQDRDRVAEEGELARLHLLYALELKDDMAVIDWAKGLEKLEKVSAFQATVNSKVIAEGGNRGRLPSLPAPGVYYSFPDQWGFRSEQKKGAQNQIVFLFARQTSPGPFQWGLLCFFACLLTGMAVFLAAPLRFPPAEPAPVPERRSSPAAAAAPSSGPERVQLENPDKKAVLLLDKNYVIRQVTPHAARYLKKNISALMNAHLLDLEPDPSLFQAIDKAVEVKLSMPFPSNPEISAVLKPAPEGSVLILETAQPSETP